MFIFSGWRTIAAFVVVGLVVNATESVSEQFAVVAFAASGLAVCAYGRVINAPRPVTMVTGETVSVSNTNSLFWIPLQYWGLLIAAAGTFALVSGSSL